MTGQNMKTLQATAAKAKFSELLKDVERGETVVITRHGKEIAEIRPPSKRRREEIEAAIAGIKEIRKRTKPWSTAEILEAIKEGRK